MSQIGFFDGGKRFKIDKPVRLIELFAGIGSQAKALERLNDKGLLLYGFEHYRICEFDKYAVKSYNAIHGTDFETTDCKKAYNYKIQRKSYIFHKKKENPDYIPKEEKVQFAEEKEKKTKRKKPKSISQCIAIIEKYNRENGTHYTYGNFSHKEMFD